LFPGLDTPDPDLILHCLYSYGEEKPVGGGQWRIRPQDQVEVRRAEIEKTEKILFSLADRLGFSVQKITETGNAKPHSEARITNVWEDSQNISRYAFSIISSAVIGEIVRQKGALAPKPQQGFCHVIVLPGGRSNLVAFKLSKDARLNKEIEQGWIFLKYRHLRRLIENPLLSAENLIEQLELDPLTYTATQMRLL
jgi:hypothetical protein